MSSDEIKPAAWEVLAGRIEWLKAYSADGAYPKLGGPSAGRAYELALELERLQSDHDEAMAAKDAEIERLRAESERRRVALNQKSHEANLEWKRAEQAEARAAAGQDAARLDALELLVDQQPDKMLLLHHGNGAGKNIAGLGLSNTRRSLRQAIDQAAQRGTGETK